jgi:hypothetical protein
MVAAAVMPDAPRPFRASLKSAPTTRCGGLGHKENKTQASVNEVLAALPALRGENLACWCRLPRPGQPDNCHAALLLELAGAE